MPSLNREYAQNFASTLGEEVDELRRLMTDVATGGPRIQEVNDDYKAKHQRIVEGLVRLELENPNPYRDLWDWYSRWSSGDLPSYRSRRQYLRELFTPLEDQLRQIAAGLPPSPLTELTGWVAVDRVLGKMRHNLSSAVEPEDFQAVGLLGRELLISLAQAVYDPETHGSVDSTTPSKTDANRMLEAFIVVELSGGSNEEVRKHARAALALAIGLQHRRTADFRMAALCVEATGSVVNIVAIVSGRRDPVQPG